MTTLADSKHTAYIWVNWLYMNEKQWGIQTAHCVSDMSLMEYGKDAYRKWASDDKTILMFNGTNSGTIKRTFTILQWAARNLKRAGIEIPTVMFREDEESLDGAVTACGFILPDEVRTIGWDTYPSYYGTDHWSDLFLPNIRAEEDALVPFDVTTEYLLGRVENDDATHKVLSERRGFGGYTGYEDYSRDSFKLPHFTHWLNRQRLA
jgi:hypothetical protein